MFSIHLQEIAITNEFGSCFLIHSPIYWERHCNLCKIFSLLEREIQTAINFMILKWNIWRICFYGKSMNYLHDTCSTDLIYYLLYYCPHKHLQFYNLHLLLDIFPKSFNCNVEITFFYLFLKAISWCIVVLCNLASMLKMLTHSETSIPFLEMHVSGWICCTCGVEIRYHQCQHTRTACRAPCHIRPYKHLDIQPLTLASHNLHQLGIFFCVNKQLPSVLLTCNDFIMIPVKAFSFWYLHPESLSSVTILTKHQCNVDHKATTVLGIYLQWYRHPHACLCIG